MTFTYLNLATYTLHTFASIEEMLKYHLDNKTNMRIITVTYH